MQFEELDIRYGIFREIEFPVLLQTETKKFYLLPRVIFSPLWSTLNLLIKNASAYFEIGFL